MKIIHIGPESQFVSFVAESFESAAPGVSEFFVLKGPDGHRGSYGMRNPQVHLVSSRLVAMPHILKAARASDMIIAHSMSGVAALAFVCSRPVTKRVWSGWGFDYYGSDESSDEGLLGLATLELALRLRSPIGRRNVMVALKDWATIRLKRSLVHHAAARTDSFSAPIPADSEVFRKRFPEFRGGYSKISYASVEDTFARGVEAPSCGNILVGNSATPSNNHVELFDILKDLNVTGRRIVVPLSYGDHRYGDAVIAKGRGLFGEAFEPIVDFMPLEEYLSLVGTCGVVIMNHKRQQASGNICAAIYHGAHVFLNETSPALEFFRSLGVFLYSIGELETQGLPSAPLPPEVVQANRDALETFWGVGRVAANVQALVSQVDQ